MSIHKFAAAGDLSGVRAEIAKGAPLEAYGKQGNTPLMVAVASTEANVAFLQSLIVLGADVNALSVPAEYRPARSVLSIAASAARIFLGETLESLDAQFQHNIAATSVALKRIKLLAEAGADVRFVDTSGYSVLMRANHVGSPRDEDEIVAILDFLIASGAPLDAVSKYGESLLRESSYRGNFARVKWFFEKGADPEPLGWSPFFFAVAFCEVNVVEKFLDKGALLDERDCWERTPFLLSVYAGRLDTSKLLFSRGSDRAAVGRGGDSALMYAIYRNDAPMLSWLISEGLDVEAINNMGRYPLSLAVGLDAVECVQILLHSGACVTRRDELGHGIMSLAESPAVVELLVAAGQDITDANSRMRSQLTGIASNTEIPVTSSDFWKHKSRRFGRRNPDRMNNPFWEYMIRMRGCAYGASREFGDSRSSADPVWCFDRYGQSFTRLPDGRYVEIGGEHEDTYDPDFCIYNDVVVYRSDGTFDILGYPESDFPPTDFHSATFCAPYIYIIGNLGYVQSRRSGETPIFRLHCETWAIEEIESKGAKPGWIHEHRAKLVGNDRIEISGGKIIVGKEQNLLHNSSRFVLDLKTFTWQVD